MGRRKGGKVMSKTLFSYRRESRKEISQTLVSCTEENDESAKSGEEDKGGFFACYLLTSLSPRHKGHTYIGFTVNPRRRIRQHNGEITSGAWRTKRKRPWEMVMCIYGFPNNVSALQFEWAWQHPLESCAVRNVATSFKSLSGLANKIKLGLTMLTLPNWQNLNLMVNFFSTKYSKHSAGCPSLPEQMRDQVSSMDELPCYTGIYNMHEDEDEGEGLHKDDDDLDGNDFQNKFNVADNISTSEGLPNIADENHRDNYKSTEGTTIHYRSGWWEGDFMRETEDSFNPTGDLNLGYGDLFNSTKENGVELDQTTTKEMPAISDVNNDPPVVNSPISAHEVEVIDLLSPTPGYRIGLKSKKRKVSCVSSGIIDLTKSPIFV